MTNNLIPLLLKSKIDFFAKHLVASEFKRPPYDYLNFWDQYDLHKFSLTNGVWKSENKGQYSSGGIVHEFDSFGNISFSYKTSTNSKDSFLVVTIDWNFVFARSGEHDWTHFEYNAVNTLKNCSVAIFYYNGKGAPDRSNTVWLKDLEIKNVPKPNPSTQGWSLFHQFASYDNQPPYPSVKTIEGKFENINSTEELQDAGISYNFNNSHINNDANADGYMLIYSPNNDIHIETPLPDGYNTVMVEYGNLYRSPIYLYIGGKIVESLDPWQGYQTYKGSYKHGDTIKIEGKTSFFIKAIWVKKER